MLNRFAAPWSPTNILTPVHQHPDRRMCRIERHRTRERKKTHLFGAFFFAWRYWQISVKNVIQCHRPGTRKCRFSLKGKFKTINVDHNLIASYGWRGIHEISFPIFCAFCSIRSSFLDRRWSSLSHKAYDKHELFECVSVLGILTNVFEVTFVS